MEELRLLLALALPFLLGGLWLNAIVPVKQRGRRAIVPGCGGLLGLLVLPQILHLLDMLGFGLSFNITAMTVAGIAVLTLLTRGAFRRTSHAFPLPTKALTRAEYALLGFLVLLIVTRLVGLGLEIVWRPLFPWDATMHWATKTRVWFEHGTMVPFVDNNAWLDAAGSGVYTDRHPKYPATIPLLQVWMNLAIGRWDESLLNLPWLACLGALGVAFFGHLRLAGVSTIVATISTYMLLSMPLVNIHVALAGYADLFLGAAYGCAIMSLHNWVHSRQTWLAVLTLLFALLCTVIKNEGFIWALTILPGIAVAMMQRRQAAKTFLLLALWGVLFILLIPPHWEVAGHTVKDIRLTFNLEALLGIIKSLWLHDNWHLFGFLLLGIIPVGILMPGAMTRTYLAVSVTLACSVGAYLFMFIFTGFGVGAADFAAVGRLSIHLIPALLFLCTLLYHEILQRGSIFSPPSSKTLAG